MSKIYHIKPKDNRKKQKEPLWKYILVNDADESYYQYHF